MERASSGYVGFMQPDTEGDPRNVQQELAAGQSEATPVIAIGTVVVVVATFFVLALTLALLAYLLV